MVVTIKTKQDIYKTIIQTLGLQDPILDFTNETINTHILWTCQKRETKAGQNKWMPLGEKRKEDEELDGRKECMMQ
jgi:hypothetical protein